MIRLLLLPFLLFHSAFSLKTYKIDTSSWKTSQVFDGFGAVSGGGATSKLLFTYFPTENDRRRVMEIMFNEHDGLQMLKVEMGGDDQSTEGSESSHMSERGQLSKRSYEFQLIREALNVNPSLPICVLPWTFPGWLGDSPYQNYTETAEYVVEWLRIGRDTWKFDTYCVGIWNERNFSESYVKELRRLLDASGLQKTLIVAGEGFRMDDSYARLLDKDFIDHYDIIGVHYPGGQIPANVQRSGKRIWASEDYSTDNRDTGMGSSFWSVVHQTWAKHLKVPIPTQIVPKVLAQARHICLKQECDVQAKELKPGEATSASVSKQHAHFYEIDMLEEYRNNGVAIICKSSSSKFKLVLFDKEGGVRMIQESGKRGKSGTQADMFFIPYTVANIQEFNPMKYHLEDKETPITFHYLDSFEMQTATLLESRKHYIAVYGDNWINDVKYTMNFLPVKIRTIEKVFNL